MNMIWFKYDAEGRLLCEGSKTDRYGYLDKVLSVTDGDMTRTYTYHADGQLASATVGGDHRALRNTPQTETFQWDGLALIQRGDEQFINEPHIGGGNPVASSKGTSYFNDMLGTTVGSKKSGKYSAAALTAFGERLDNVDSTSPAIRSLGEGWFTGKPYVEGLGHAFLMRNYRAGLAKWQTADPLGYPDGWNALAYCGNGVTSAVDLWGCKEIVLLGEVDHSGYHVATVWAECNHNYYKPKFTIQVGQLKDHPDNEYVKANVDGKTNIPATPNFSYVTTYAYTDADIAHQVTLENFVLVVNEAVPVDEFLNKIIMWEYQVEFDVKEEWEENSALNKKTRVEKQEKVSGRHTIEE